MAPEVLHNSSNKKAPQVPASSAADQQPQEAMPEPAPAPPQAHEPSQEAQQPADESAVSQCQQGAGHSFATDVWAVGCVMYEMLLGVSPFASKPVHSVRELVLRIRDTDPVDLLDLPQIRDQISAEARDFIGDCLSRHPGDRPTVLQLLAHPLVQKYSRQCSTIFGRMGSTSCSMDWSSTFFQ